MANYTHGQHPSVVDSYRWRNAANSAAYALGEFTPGRRVLDLGCGPGTITVDVAARVAPGRVVAVDSSAEAVELARRSAVQAGLDNIDFLVGDVRRLGLAEASFDVVHAHQVLQHVDDPVAALAQMRRVTRPGGVVAACDSDYSGMFWHPRLPELDAWMQLYQALARRNGGEPEAGRYMLSWARAAGFTDPVYEAEVWSHSDPAGRTWWGQMWARRILESETARQAVRSGLATRQDLERISAGWLRWSQEPDAVFVIPRGALLCRV